MMPPTSIDGTDITGATIDGTDVQEITVDGDTVFTALAASEANQKLVHRWLLSESSPPFTDSIGSANSVTTTGTTQVTGDYVDGAARSSDGTDDVIDFGGLGSFFSTFGDGAFAIAASIKGLTASNREIFISGRKDANNFVNLNVNNNTTDVFEAEIKTSGATDSGQVSGSTTITDGSEYRLVFNVTGPDTSDIELWVNQSEETTTVENSETMSNPSDWTAFNLFRWAGDGFYSDIIIDDVCVFDDSLTQSEIESYENPWL